MGAGACGIWRHREEAQRALHETMHLAEARLERHAPGRSMPSEAPKHCKIQGRRDAPKMAILEAPCAQNAPGRSTLPPLETLLPRNPTWESPHFSGLTKKDTSIKNSDPETSPRTPSLTPSEILYVGFLYVLFSVLYLCLKLIAAQCMQHAKV